MESNQNTYYLIYARPKNSGRKFKALDIESGELVDKLLYASMFDSEEEVNDVVSQLRKQNTGWEFKTRRCSPKAPSLEVDLD